jgi:hypothetical protein
MAQSTLNYPPTVVEDQLDTMVNTMERQLREYGIENLEQYLQQMGQTVEQYRDSMRDQAEIMAKRNLLISEVFRQEGISVSDEEIDERIDRMLGIVPGGENPEDENIAAEAAPDEETHEHEAHEHGEHEGHSHEGHSHDEHEGHSHGEESADTMHALRDMMKSGSGRAVLESQILQESSIARLLAIVRGEEVPERPAPVAAAEGESSEPVADETATNENATDEAPTGESAA